MTRVAKLLVFVNLFLSLLFATWALAVYSNRIDWGRKPASADRAAGELSRRLEEIDRLGGGSKEGARQRAEVRWQRARKILQDRDVERARNQAWYADQLLALETGTDTRGRPVTPPVQNLVYEQGQVRFDPATGFPQLQPVADKAGQPLASRRHLEQEYQATQGQIKQVMKALEGLVQQERQLTAVVTGDGQQKGLRGRLAQEQAETEKALGEQDYLKPLLYNRQVEAQLLQQRQQALQERLNQVTERVSRRGS